MTQIATNRLGYKSQLDGVRGLAVLAVMASHAHPTVLKGGEYGVDVFFALSGFLITTLILEELAASRSGFGFRSFYIRRSLRLFPALYGCVLLVIAYLALRWNKLPEFLEMSGVTDPNRRGLYPRFVFGALTYTTNLIGVTQTRGNLLGHTWSLAVEEQFYLLWPFFLVRLWRRGAWRVALSLPAAFVGISLVLRLVGVPTDNGFLWGRPEAIAAGVWVAIARWKLPRLRFSVQSWAGAMIWIGGAVIALSILLRDHLLPSWLFSRGGSSILGVVAAGLIWALIEDDGQHPVSRMLRLRPLVYIGMISYGLYLFHMPIFRVVGWELPGLGGSVNTLLKVSASFLIASLSFRFFEQPFKLMQHRFRPIDDPERAIT